jgi:hypothetical protein
MRDRRLEKNIDRLEAFIERWKALSQHLEKGFQGSDFTAAEETEFLELKSAIAQDYELLLTTLGSEADRDERPLRLLNAVPSLHSTRELGEGMTRKLGTDWHSVYLGLQALLGRLKGRRAQLAAVSSVRVGFRRVFSNPLVIVLVAALAMYGAYALALWIIPRVIELRGK